MLRSLYSSAIHMSLKGRGCMKTGRFLEESKWTPEPEFVNVEGAQESMPSN
jgi:hypothetical protein